MYEVFQIDRGITTVVTQAEVPLEVRFATVLKCLITDTKPKTYYVNLTMICVEIPLHCRSAQEATVYVKMKS